MFALGRSRQNGPKIQALTYSVEARIKTDASSLRHNAGYGIRRNSSIFSSLLDSKSQQSIRRRWVRHCLWRSTHAQVYIGRWLEVQPADVGAYTPVGTHFTGNFYGIAAGNRGSLQ